MAWCWPEAEEEHSRGDPTEVLFAVCISTVKLRQPGCSSNAMGGRKASRGAPREFAMYLTDSQGLIISSNC